MGYTHYWNKTSKMRAAAWSRAIGLVNLLLRANTVPIEVEEVDIKIPKPGLEQKARAKYRTFEPRFQWHAFSDNDDTVSRANNAAWEAWMKTILADLPQVRYHALHIEGVGEDAHETFVIPFRISRLDARGFCKTARKPYDKLVVACLCVLAEAGLEVQSDGEPEDWEEGRAWAESVLGRKVKIPGGVTCYFCANTGAFNRKDLVGQPWIEPKGLKLGDPCPRCAEYRKEKRAA